MSSNDSLKSSKNWVSKLKKDKSQKKIHKQIFDRKNRFATLNDQPSSREAEFWANVNESLIMPTGQTEP